MQYERAASSWLSVLIQKVTRHPYFLPILYLVFITLAEGLTTLLTTVVGLTLHGLVLVMLLVHGAITDDQRLQRFLFSMALVPLIRLMSLSLPLVQFPFVTWYMIVGAPLLIASFFTARAINYDAKKVGFRFSWRDLPLQLLVSMSGIGLGYLEYVILRPEPLVKQFSFAAIVIPALILLFFTGLLEEVIFRGLLQGTSRPIVGKFYLFYVSIIFAVMHLGYKSLLDLGFVFTVAMLFGLVASRTGTIYGVTLAHGLTNIGLFLVFPFLVGPAESAPVIPVATVTQPAMTATAPAEVIPVQPASATPLPLPSVTDTSLPPPTDTPVSSTTVAPTFTSTPLPALTSTLSAPIVIDDGDPGYTNQGGHWWQTEKGYQGDLLWMYESFTVVETSVEWKPVIEGCGLYKVEVYLPQDYAKTHRASYKVIHRNGESEVLLDQGAQQGGWASLGEYEFSSDAPGVVKLDNYGGSEKGNIFDIIAFDAARWTLVGTCGALRGFTQ